MKLLMEKHNDIMWQRMCECFMKFHSAIIEIMQNKTCTKGLTDWQTDRPMKRWMILK